jgi:4-diphosphocytidyl-2-C-methyl-D-erythritol kinase
VLINSFAKINLFLEVLNKRPDGYHEIETLFSTISLHDSLKFALTKKPGIKILSNIPELASQNNLVHKVARRIMEDFGVKSGIEVFIRKRIPVAAGLGGGSSNAAVTFIALKALFKLAMDDSYMSKTAAEFGSDINFFFSGGLTRGTGRGEKIELLPDIPVLNLLLVNPGLAIASREAYELIENADKYKDENQLWFNRLESGIVKKYPAINDVIETMKELGAEQAMMSGSGATCIGLFKTGSALTKSHQYFQSLNIWCKEVKTMKRSQYQACFQNLS